MRLHEIFPKSLLWALTGKAKPIWSSLTYRYTLLMTSSYCSHCLGFRRLVTSFFALKRRLLTVFSRVFSRKPHVVAHTSTPHSPFSPRLIVYHIGKSSTRACAAIHVTKRNPIGTYAYLRVFCVAKGWYRFSAFWLRSKCSICSYQLNIWYALHWRASILNWFLGRGERLGACSILATG